MSEEEGYVLKQANPELYAQMATLTNAQRQGVLELVGKLASDPKMEMAVEVDSAKKPRAGVTPELRAKMEAIAAEKKK